MTAMLGSCLPTTSTSMDREQAVFCRGHFEAYNDILLALWDDEDVK